MSPFGRTIVELLFQMLIFLLQVCDGTLEGMDVLLVLIV